MNVTGMDVDSVKKVNKRQRRKLFLKIKSQMEFYFSDSNLAKDKFLQDLISQSSDGYVDLEVFKSFNRIKGLTDDIGTITAAVSKSDILEVSSDGKKVRRITPVQSSKDFDACTVYVEKLPAHGDQQWIRNIFERFGTVDYINIPRFKVSNKIKGFAFVEFNDPESAKEACKFYKRFNGKESCASGEEHKIPSGKRKKAEDTADRKAKKGKTGHASVEKLICDNSSNNPESDTVIEQCAFNSDHEKERIGKKRKHESEEVKPIKKRRESEIEPGTKSNSAHVKSDIFNEEHRTLSENENKCSANIEEPSAISENHQDSVDEEICTKPKKRRKHKRNRDSGDRPTLRVMSKYDKFIDKFNTTDCYNFVANVKRFNAEEVKEPWRTNCIHTQRAEWKSYRNKYLALQRATMAHLKKTIVSGIQELKEQELSSKSNLECNPEVPKKGLHFQPGVIIKVKLSQAVKTPSDIKDQVKANAVVAYIDAPLGHSEIFVRCHTSEEALAFINEHKLQHLGTAELLKDTEEAEYWKKIESDRNTKFSTPVTHKKRGRDKIIAKATKLAEQKNKHIYFDE